MNESAASLRALVIVAVIFLGLTAFWVTVLGMVVLADKTPALAPSLLTDHKWGDSLIDVFLATAIGYAIAKIQESFSRRHERRLVRSGVIRCLEFNRQLIAQAKLQMDGVGQPVNVPNYPLDADGLTYWVARARAVLSDATLNSLDGLRFQLAHVNQKLQTCPASADPGFRAAFASIRTHLDQLHTWTLERLVEVERETVR